MTASPLARHQVFLRKQKAAKSPTFESGFFAASARSVKTVESARWRELLCAGRDGRRSFTVQRSFREEFTSRGTKRHEIICCGNQSVGCFAIEEHSVFLTVKKLYLEPASQNKGIGAKTIHRIVSDARTKGLRTALSVLTTNPAKRFYEREEFVVVSQANECILHSRQLYVLKWARHRPARSVSRLS